MRLFLLTGLLLVNLDETVQPQTAEPLLHLREDFAASDQVVQLACDSAVLAADEVGREESFEDVGREVAEVADGGGDDRQPTPGRGRIDCLRSDTSEEDCFEERCNSGV